MASHKALEPRTSARDAKAWRKWLERHHASASKVWLVFSRKHTGQACVSYDEAVEEALCFGWIDGIKKRVDEDHYTYRFSPRQPGSRWSLINRKRAESLVANGRMAPAGLAAIEEGKKPTLQPLRQRSRAPGDPPAPRPGDTQAGARRAAGGIVRGRLRHDGCPDSQCVRCAASARTSFRV
jgi:uncharacterized protein YdeI (YjbR/CyaY-like superfamily)